MNRFSLARRMVLAGLAALGLAATVCPVAAQDGAVTVFAAASLKDVLREVAEAWKAETGNQVRLSFGASSALARQVEQGAPADIFISADSKWMDHLDKAGAIIPESRVDLLGNRLVLVGGNDAPAFTLQPGADLGAALAGGRLAVGLTASVPAGIYARQALERLSMWEGVKNRLAESENVRAALALVARGEAPLGIVYETDAKAQKGVRQLGVFPPQSHDPIIYPAALTTTARRAQAGAFLAYLRSAPASRLFEQAGFSTLKSD